MKDRKIFLATLAALGAQVIFGFSFMFTKIALDYASPMTVIADRYIIAFLGMTLVMLFTKTNISFPKNIWKLIVMSVFQPLLYFIFESYGIRMTTSTFSSVMISMIPVVSMICGIFVLKEIPSVMQYLFTALSVGGVVITAFAGSADGTVTLPGIFCLLGAVISSVGYNITSRRISSEFSVFERTYAMMAIGLVSFVAVSLAENAGNPIGVISAFAIPRYTFGILYLGIFSSVIAFLLLNYANTYLPVTKTTVFSNITTVVSVIAGTLFLNEQLSPVTAIAAVMIVAGVFGVQMYGLKSAKG